MGTVSETCALVKFSLKREKLLGTIREQVEGVSDDDNDTSVFIFGYTLHCPLYQTRHLFPKDNK